MAERDSIEMLLVHRRLTRSIADTVRDELTRHVSVLTPLLRPEAVFGEYIEGGRREANQKPAQALKELQTLYDAIAPQKPLNLRRELTTPFTFGNVGLELTPVEYTHAARSRQHERKITVRRPLTWTLTYAGYGPAKLQTLLDAGVRSPEELQRVIVAYLLLHFVLKHQRGVTHILDELHFPVSSITLPEFGDLPVTRIGIAVSTHRPSDDVVIESAELTGMDAFEEMVKVEDISHLRSPFAQRLLDLVARHTPAAASN